ncbi:MAG: phosphate/phosphite/phosphonate ABC transporter substrate-binding protein [Pseudomonadota bacterium]
MHTELRPIFLYALFSGFFISAPASHANEVRNTQPYMFGIVPQQSATRLAKIWVPLLERISQKTGVPLEFATAKDIPTFEACLAKGAYDFSYMNPYHYTTFHKLSGYQAFARQADKKLRGLIVVKKDSPYQSLQDLNNTAIAYPSPAAFGASVIPRAEMKKLNMTIKPSYVKSHDSVYRSVVAGLFPAGGGVLRTYGNIPDGLREQLRILYKTNAYTPHAFAAHPRIDQKHIDTIMQAMLVLSKENSNLLKPLGMQGFETAKNADWDDVRSLNLSDGHTKIIKDDRITCHSG